MPSVPRTIPLTVVIPVKHQNVFATLLSVNAEKNLNAVLRVAGGWVRDALLHVHSNDIDVAIETPADAPEQVSGRLFADAVSEYEASHAGARARTVSTIRVNPAMSKHIETATVCVHDIPVEFCALRTDDYCDDSRIPQVRPATPLEDARRRDFTVNALFYNLSTGNVEDFTTGFDDLQARVLRCPLEPRKTFQDDPLRLLRGVRFVGQLGDLGFRLDETIPACVDATLLEMLLQKVSRERIGKEVTKMLTGAHPAKCVELLYSMSLLQRVLLVEVYMKAMPGAKKKLSAEIDHVVYLSEAGPQDAMSVLLQLNRTVVPCLSASAAANQEEEVELCFGLQDDERLVAVLFTLILPFFRNVDNHTELEDRLYAVIINGLKMPVAIHNAVRRMADCYSVLRRSKLAVGHLSLTGGAMPEEAKRNIMNALETLNDKSAIPDAFKVTLFTYLLLECRPDILQRGESGDERAAIAAVELFTPLWANVEKQPYLLNAFKAKPLISGEDIRALSGVQAKQIGEILRYVREQRALHSDSTRESMLEKIKERYGDTAKNTTIS